MNQHSNSKGTVLSIILVVVFILAALSGAWYLFQYKPGLEAQEKAQLEQAAREEAERKRVEQATQRKAKYDQLIVDADAAFGQENWESARSLYSEASSLLPGEQYPKDQISQIDTRLTKPVKKKGVVEKVSTRTGRFYVVVSSSIDDDLAMDYANKLAKEGNSVKVIEHDTNEHLFYRVTLGDYNSQEQAEATLGSFSSYGEGIWVLKY